MSSCSVCAKSAARGIEIDTSRSNKAWALELGVNEASIRRHLKHAPIGERPIKPAKDDWSVGITFDPETGAPREIRTPPVPESLGDDYEAILAVMNYRLPVGYELRLVEVNYNQQAWTRDHPSQESAITRPNVRYRFKVIPVTVQIVTDADFAAATARVQSWKLPVRSPGTGLGTPIGAVLNLADMQLAKSEGGGIAATEQRLWDGLENFDRWVTRQRKTGRNIDELAIINNGDPGEGIAGNYAAQTHTVEGGLRKQMNLILDVWTQYAVNLYPKFDKGQFVSVLCNHMEFGRQGGAAKSITSDSDNGSAFLAETLERILIARPAFEHVKFTVPHDEMNVYTDIAGVATGFNHGHKIPGADATGFEKWLNGQARGDDKANKARLWFTAHKHNFQAWDLGSTFAFSCPSCDGGSKWLRDTAGRFSRSGILAVLVDPNESLGWSDMAFL